MGVDRFSRAEKLEFVDGLVSQCSENQTGFKSYAYANFDRIHADYHFIKPYISNNTRILDIGAVPPLMGHFIGKSGLGHYTVLDPDPGPFRKFLDTNQSAMIEGNIAQRRLISNESPFDFVLLNEVVEHVSGNLIDSISNALSFVKPGGHILVTTPNLRSVSGLYALLTRSSGLASKPDKSVREQYERVQSYGYFGHIREYTEKEVIDLMVSFGVNHVSSVFQSDYRNYTDLRKVVVVLEHLFPKWRLFGKYLFQKPANASLV
ncbi:MAG: methyltransferase domain-containing protein [Verrucomicrobiota bacterium]